MKLSALLFSAFVLAAPAFAQASDGAMSGSGALLYAEAEAPPETSADSASEESESEGSERRICRRVEVNSASRMPTRRLCLTARQWREYHRRTN